MRHVFSALVTVLALSSSALAGCGGVDAPVDGATIAVAPRANALVFGEFVARMDPKAKTMTISRVGGPRAFGPSLEPESVDNLPIVQDGVSGSGPASTVELVNNSCADNYPGTSTFQCNVTLRHFFARSFSNVFVQVTSIKSSTGADISGSHAATNSYGGNTFGLDASKGLWQYTATGATTDGVLAQSPNNAGTADWVFANPDDAVTQVQFAVWGTKAFSNYTFSFGNAGYTDACSGGTSTTSNGQVSVTLPFDFTLYGVNSTSIKLAKNGQIGVGATALTASNSAIALPSTSAPHPIIFPFWDGLKYGSGGQMCYQTLGSAPNRQFVVEWRNMDFTSAPGTGSSLDFEAFLYEGTGEIDTVYNAMTGTGTSAGRENGGKATVGIQDGTGTISTSEFQVEDYGSGNAYSYIPNPI